MTKFVPLHCQNWASINSTFGFIKWVGCDSINMPGRPANMMWSNTVLGLSTPCFIRPMSQSDVR